MKANISNRESSAENVRAEHGPKSSLAIALKVTNRCKRKREIENELLFAGAVEHSYVIHFKERVWEKLRCQAELDSVFEQIGPGLKQHCWLVLELRQVRKLQTACPVWALWITASGLFGLRRASLARPSPYGVIPETTSCFIRLFPWPRQETSS